MVWFGKFLLPKKETNPKRLEKILWTGSGSGDVLQAGGKESQLEGGQSGIPRGQVDILFPVPKEKKISS